MEVLNLVLLFAAGCVSGFLGGLFGAAGWMVLVPILLVFFQSSGVSSLVATHMAVGTSLLILAFTSAASAYGYHRTNQVVWRAVLFIGAAGIAGGVLGTLVTAEVSGKTLQRAFAVVAAAAMLRLLAETRKPKSGSEPNIASPGLLVTGFFVGGASAITGTDSGVFSLPLLYSRFFFPLKKAIGTSSAGMAFIAIAATAGYVILGWGKYLVPSASFGYVDIIHAFPIVAGSLLLMRPGNAFADSKRVGMLRKIYAAFLLVVALKMLLF